MMRALVTTRSSTKRLLLTKPPLDSDVMFEQAPSVLIFGVSVADETTVKDNSRITKHKRERKHSRNKLRQHNRYQALRLRMAKTIR